MVEHGIAGVLFYLVACVLVLVTVFTLLLKFASYMDPAKAKVMNKRKRKTLPPYVQALIPLVVIFVLSHCLAWYYTLTPDITVWDSDVRASVVCFGAIPALILACIIYVQANRPRI